MNKKCGYSLCVFLYGVHDSLLKALINYFMNTMTL